MKTQKLVINDSDEDEEDQIDEAEEARFKAEQLEKELKEQNKFDCLCDGVLNCLSLLDSSFGELLELKDELLQHDLPPSLQVAVTLVAGKLFRSITDLHTPVQELTRLVNVYSIPWEQRSEALKKLHNDYESKQRQLNIAIRRLQLIDAHTRRVEREKKVMNWEKAFAKVTSGKSHGRRWKFMIEAFKKKAKQGISLSDYDVEFSDDESEGEQDEAEHMEADDGAAEKQRFMLSVIAASPPADEDGTPQVGSDIESEADGIPSEISDSSGNDEEGSPDVKRKGGVSFTEGPEERVEVIEDQKPSCEERGTWTDEPEYDVTMAVRVFRPLQLKDDDNDDVSCTISFAENHQKTPVLPLATAPSSDEQQADEVDQKTKGRRKSIGFASKPTSPPALTKTKQKPGGILKKVKLPEDDAVVPESEKVNRSKFEEVFFPFDEAKEDPIRFAIHQGERSKMVAMATMSWAELHEQELPSKFEEEAGGSEDDLTGYPLSMLPLQGLKLGLGGHSPGQIGQLPVLIYWVKRKRERRVSVEVNTGGVRELIMEVTGVDINEVTKEELVAMLGRDYNDACTSAMSFVSSSSHKSQGIPLAELEVIREQHEVELKNIQDEYELKMEQLIMEIEKLQTAQMQQAVASAAASGVTFADPASLPVQATFPEIVRPPSGDKRPSSGGRWRAPKHPQLPDWGAHLPKDVWERMRLLTEEMLLKRRQVDASIRTQIAANIEKKLASQYKLQRNDSSIHGPLQDVSLPALFMPSRSGNVYNPRARLYFHPTGTAGDLRLTQPPSMFQLPPLPEKARMSVVNLFDLSKNFQPSNASDWLNRIASAPSRGSRATTAGSRMTPHTPAPTANIQASDVC